jgi:spermidine/putrescine transport system permease protein
MFAGSRNAHAVHKEVDALLRRNERQIQILGRVLIPLSKPGIATGITMVFVPAVSTFIISRMLGGGANLLIGDLIELQFLGNSYNLNLGSAMSLVLMVIVLLCMSFTSSFDEEEMEGVM